MNSPVITFLSSKIHQIVVYLLTLRFGGLFEFTKTINATISIIKNLNKVKQQNPISTKEFTSKRGSLSRSSKSLVALIY